ncbi:protein phosphatase regulator [Ophidiomyces ophidiicola]|nr:protein phosphatase regulator [Ophidiomyces ophidiicola]
MTRPQMIRAGETEHYGCEDFADCHRLDTIDLQNPDAPSTQDHSRSANSKVSRSGHGRHQDQTLRNAEQDMLEEIARGPLSPEKDSFQEDIQKDQTDLRDRSDKLRSGRTGGYENLIGDDVGDGDLDDQLDDDEDDDDMLDKISSSPSIDDEDIDFEFVYALHTFFATVEGQANATKGDTMVLLDDSNSYWWLVRVVKDGSIGYLPAEHIETPTERLARLNKHRNVDLSATMLGDNAEKSKNPLKKAMRRRNAKTVTFASPVYFEPSDIDYSTEEDADGEFLEEQEDEDGAENSDAQVNREESGTGNINVEPLRSKLQADGGMNAKEEESQRQSLEQDVDTEQPSNQQGKSPCLILREHCANVFLDDFKHGRSRNGTLRNTDSFFKDDTGETKKISLTPNLLRDDATETASIDSKEMKTRGSFETLVSEKGKDDKKRKEKKPGMLSGLFKRKDKKSKAEDEADDNPEKISEESSRSSTDRKMSIESLKEESRSPKQQVVSRQLSKLTKQASEPVSQPMESVSSTNTSIAPSVRAIIPESKEGVSELRIRPSDMKQEPSYNPPLDRDPTSTISAPPRTDSIHYSLQPIDAADKPSEIPIALSSTKVENMLIAPPVISSRPAVQEAPVDRYRSDDAAVLPKEQAPPEEDVYSTGSVPPPSSDPLETSQSKSELNDIMETAPAPTPSPVWNDAGLRAYLEDGSDIRDLLIIVHDKSNVLPAGPDHPITGNLFREESKALNEMSSRLDEMLAGWLARKPSVAAR